MVVYYRCPSCGNAVRLYDGRDFVEERKRTEKLRLSAKQARAMASLAEKSYVDRREFQCDRCSARFFVEEKDTWSMDAH